MRKIAILDTGIDTHQDSVKRLLQGFAYEEIDLLSSDADRHPHGTMVMQFALRPWDTDSLRDRVFFYHLRIGNSSGGIDREATKKALELVVDLGCTAMIRSWGAPDYDMPDLEDPDKVTGWYRELADRIQVAVDMGVIDHSAAGNSETNAILGGDLDDDVVYPQRCFKRGGNTLIWGAVTKEGKHSGFTSDGPMVFGCFWAHKATVLDPADGRWCLASGTSFAAPKGCGYSELLLELHPEYSNQNVLNHHLAAIAVHKDDAGNDYIGPDGTKHHVSFGFGTLEPFYQEATREARTRPPKEILPEPVTHWVDFQRLRKTA